MRYIVAAVQMDTAANKEQNLSKIEAFVREAARQGASLIVLPERAEYMGRGMREQAEPIPGRTSERLTALSRELKVHILCGVGESSDVRDDGAEGPCATQAQDAGESSASPYNTLLLMGPDGEILSKYRKIHMFQVEGTGGVSVDESRFTTPGDEIVTVDTELGRLGMSICYDLRFPELYRALASKGAEVLFVPSDFTYDTGKDHWEILLRARAIENTCYVVAGNQCGQKPKYRAYGHSMIIDPWGRVLAEAGESEEIIYGEIDSELIAEIRQQMPSLSNIRNDIFR
jgi:predicted amidohydrolase